MDFEPSQDHLRTISRPSQLSQYRQLDLWCGTTTSGPEKCSQVQLIHSASELIPKIKMLSKPSQNHLKTISKLSQNHLKTISKPSQTISSHLKPSRFYPRCYLRPLTNHKKYADTSNNVFCIPIELKNMKIHQNHLRTIS